MFGPVPAKIDGLTRGWRRNAVLALAALVFAIAALIAFRAIAAGAGGEILRVRFGGDTERTRVVIDLEASARGQIVDSAAGSTRFTLALTGVGPGDSPRGAGLGLVRQYEVDSVAGASRLRLTLTRPAEVERRFMLPPGDGVDHYRYVIDLKAPDGAAPMQTAEAPPPPPEPEEPKLVVIDPGHGGRDPGALGANVHESEVTLAAARSLKAELERSGYRVLMTRDADVYIPHDRRVAIAREADADLFISLHADAGAAPDTRGASVYTLSEQGAERAVRRVTGQADWTREMHLPGGDPSVDRILLDLTQRATQNRSAQFARNLLAELESAEHPMLSRSHRVANFMVLLAPDVPAVLLEMGFVTNPEDETLLSGERSRRRLMRAVAEAIDGYFESPSSAMTIAARP